MKSIITALPLVLLSSWTTNLVNQHKPYYDGKLKLGKNYIFSTRDGKKYKIDLYKIDSLSLYG
nr:hypothetical protein [uncultured Chryseobacterium sp.]